MQRIGVFVCWCGSNIASTVDVVKVAEVMHTRVLLPISRITARWLRRFVFTLRTPVTLIVHIALQVKVNIMEIEPL